MRKNSVVSPAKYPLFRHVGLLVILSYPTGSCLARTKKQKQYKKKYNDSCRKSQSVILNLTFSKGEENLEENIIFFQFFISLALQNRFE